MLLRILLIAVILGACSASSEMETDTPTYAVSSEPIPEESPSNAAPTPSPTPVCDDVDDDHDGWTECAGDCDDANNQASPDGYNSYWDDEVEYCNGIDDDCDGFIDNHDVQTKCYQDLDGDGYGNLDYLYLTCDDDCMEGWSLTGADMDDTDPNYHW
jgi:hypothetical protein